MEFGIIVLSASSSVVGFLLPYVIRVVNKDIVNDDERAIASYFVCFLATMLIDWKSFVNGDIAHIALWFSVVSTEAQAAFKLYYKPKWDSQKLPDVAETGE